MVAPSSLDETRIGNGRPGDLVFVSCLDDLAPEMRKVILRAECHQAGNKALLEFADRRRVIALYRGKNKTYAGTLCSFLERDSTPDRTATLDVDKLGFSYEPEAFVAWWEDAIGMGRFEDGVDFLRMAADKAEWRPPRVRRHRPSPEPGRHESAPPASRDSLETFNDEDLGLMPASDIDAEPVRWIWPYRLACGSMGLLAGDGGLGKSQILLWIASLVSRGSPWPDGSGNAPLGDVVILSAEDRPADTIIPRLIALGADLDRISILKARVVVHQEGKGPVVSPMTFQDRPYWREIFRRKPSCRLFIADPLASYLGRGVSDSRNNEVRSVMEPFLSEIIEPREMCMLCNAHLSKSIDVRTPTHQILGSVAFSNIPRNVHVVVRDPENDARRIFAQCKCNNAPTDLPSLAFTIERREIRNSKGDAIEASAPVFEPDLITVRLADLMSKKDRGSAPKGEIDRATDWLRQRLADSPVGSLICAREGDAFLGRKWPSRDLEPDERRRIVMGRAKWWRETILKKRLDGYVKRSGYQGPFFFVLPTHAWPPAEDLILSAMTSEEEEG